MEIQITPRTNNKQDHTFHTQHKHLNIHVKIYTHI